MFRAISHDLLVNTALFAVWAVIAYAAGFWMRGRDARVAYRVGYRDGIRHEKKAQAPAGRARNEHRYTPGRADIARHDITRVMETID